jgi:cysteine desulfurase
MPKVYLDYSATTPVDKRVTKVLVNNLKNYGNTSSLHQIGQKASQVVEKARASVARAINAQPKEIIFTSSATESNNTALKGVAMAYKHKGNHIIISSIEHDCVLNAAKWLKRQGFEITELPVSKDGLINLKDLEKAITQKTILVSIIHANNEIGVIQDIKAIGKICKLKNILFHTDASQSLGKETIDVGTTNIDLLTGSSHKLYGPKGVGLLYVKKGVNIEPLLHGGGHERGLRSSTVNTALIAAFAEALELCNRELEKEKTRQLELRDWLINKLIKLIPDSYLNGHATKRLANNINIRFKYIEGESIMLMLDEKGIFVSTGSACSSNTLQPSHVLKAIGLPHEEIHGSIRISLGRWTTKEELEKLVKVLPKIIKDLRAISPFKK